MAAVSISPLPHSLEVMSNRRIALADVPNAANSPFRAVVAAAGKRSRSQATDQEELVYDQQPPAKRRALGSQLSTLRTPPKKQPLQLPESRVFDKRSISKQPTDFERKLLAAKAKIAQEKAPKQEKASVSTQAVENLKTWQIHYRKAFPTFVFYFESIPNDVRVKCLRQIASLGAREEKFFSRDVTHVVTARAIPADSDESHPTSGHTVLSSLSTEPSTSLPRTINPSLLDRSPEPRISGSRLRQARRPNYDAIIVSRKAVPASLQEVGQRKQLASKADILHKAKEMGMKIWQLEKLQRVIHMMHEVTVEGEAYHGHDTRNGNPLATAKVAQEVDLSHMLRHEQLNGPSDRDATVAPVELVPFKGPHIYIRDIDEKTKPIMFREYAKVSSREEGEWPQFRCTSQGKCPFIEEPISRRELQQLQREKAEEREMLAKAKAKRTMPITRTVSASGPPTLSLSFVAPRAKQPLVETRNGPNQVIKTSIEKPEDNPFLLPTTKRQSPTKPSNISAGTGRRLFGGEPLASGVQPSNVTSAIRSQMISSTAAAPGAKAGTSKEVHDLQRKVLERNRPPALTQSRGYESYGDVRAENVIPNARGKRKAPGILGYIHEDFTPSEEEDNARKADAFKRGAIERPKRDSMEKRALRPGYCENCKDKYDDFDIHVVGRKHRQFAVMQSNWKELDQLLSRLGRRCRDDESTMMTYVSQ